MCAVVSTGLMPSDRECPPRSGGHLITAGQSVVRLARSIDENLSNKVKSAGVWPAHVQRARRRRRLACPAKSDRPLATR